MKNLLFLFTVLLFTVSCSAPDAETGSSKGLESKATPDEQARLKALTQALGDMELVAEKYKGEQQVVSRLTGDDQDRVDQIFSTIDSDLKNNSDCKSSRKQPPQSPYTRYMGTEIKGSDCPLVMMAETIQVDKNNLSNRTIERSFAEKISYAVSSEELKSLVDVKEYKGSSELQSIEQRHSGTSTLQITNMGAGKGISSKEGKISYNYRVERSARLGSSTNSFVETTSEYSFTLKEMSVKLSSYHLKKGSETKEENYYYNGSLIKRSEFSDLLGTISLPEEMVSIEI